MEGRAEPFDIVGDSPLGVVLVHGFTASPFEVSYLGQTLGKRGFSVSAPLLPGHGTTLEDLDGTTWHQWAAAVAAATDRMAARCERVALVGQSLGGLLSLYTASRRPEVTCVASLAAPMWLDGIGAIAARLTRPGALLDRIHRLPKLGGSDVRDLEMKKLNKSYPAIPTRALDQLMQFMQVVDKALPTIKQPVLVLHGQQDHTAPVACARYIATKTHAVRLRIFPESYHLLAIDVERDIVATEVEGFLREGTLMRHVIAIDQGTTGSTVLVLDENLQLRGRGYKEFRQIYPKPGWVEHDPEEIWASVLTALKQALSGIDPSTIAAIGITNQRETSVLWNKKTGAAAHNAIVWQDRRTADRCAELKASGKQERVKQLTGLTLDPYFSGTKVSWMLHNVPGLASAASAGDIAFGTIDCYLLARLTNWGVHATDVTNASRTLLFDINTLDWSDELLEVIGVPRSLLPNVVASSGIVGETKGVPGLPDGIPIAGLAGDQQSALFGQACFTPGDAKCTYGTGAFILMNTGDKPVVSNAGLLTTVAWKLGRAQSDEVRYALEGSAFIAGAAVQWLRDGLQFFSSATEIEALAGTVADSGGVIVVPAFAGLGAPHWRPDARGAITGLTRGTTRAHIARATLEGIALQNVDILRAMERDSGRSLTTLKVDGGASANNLLMQFQADVLGVQISRPEIVETTALGALFLAGLGTGVWKDQAQVTATWREQKRFVPTSDRSRVTEHLARWDTAVAKA